MDPFGIFDQFCIEPGTKLSFETPTLVISVGYDNVPGKLDSSSKLNLIFFLLIYAGING
jgi:hypothetical protein